MSKVPSIAIGRVWQETNTFSEVGTTLEDFRRHRYVSGPAMFEGMSVQDDELAGFGDVLEKENVHIVPLLAANCWCGGPAEQAFVDVTVETVTERLRQAPHLDGVVFSMHGALASDSVPDVEGAISTAIRRQIGPDVPFVLTLDHHANVTCAMVDGEVVRQALEAGCGGEIEVEIGAKRSRRYHEPMPIRAWVERFSDGKFKVAGRGAQRVDMGECSLLRIGSIRILVSEHPGPGHDPGVYHQIGCDPRDAQIVVVKCTVGHLKVFAEIMTESLPCECPGPSPSYLDRLAYRFIPRPIYPLDRDTEWEAA